MNKKEQTKLVSKEGWDRYERSWGMGLNMTKLHCVKRPKNSKNYKLDTDIQNFKDPYQNTKKFKYL